MVDLLEGRPSGLIWVTSRPSPRELRRKGFRVFEFGVVRREFIEPARSVDLQRQDLRLPAEAWLRQLGHEPVAVLGVPLRTAGDLRDLYGYIIEPAYRRNVKLLIHAEVDLEELDPSTFPEPDMGYAWTLERLRFLAERWHLVPSGDRRPPVTPIEALLLGALERKGLAPRVQYGIDKRWRADFAFPESRLVVECDGRGWHDAQRDAERDRELRRRGWETIRFSGSQIVRDPEAVVDAVLKALAERSERLTYTDVPEESPELSWWARFLARLRHVFGRERRELEANSPSEPPKRDRRRGFDDDQSASAAAYDGVIQVIAPAGSGKTSTLVARVEVLLSRGIPANRILCTTFNKRAREHLVAQLASKGIAVGGRGVEVRNFHALGRMILEEEGRLRREIGTISYAQWRRLATQVKDQEGCVWLDPPVAQEAVSIYKLTELILTHEALARANTAEEKSAARIYELYEDHLNSVELLDFDDLIKDAVRLLQDDPEIRERWQSRWECVLVDEYQDIEPAQERLIQILAAPEDSLFVVGDEDQCIYTWRRAEVERIVQLDQAYPGLERFMLRKNYRCPSQIVTASSALIEKNQRRFPKAVEAVRDDEGEVLVEASASISKMAERCAELLRPAERGELVVLARTTRLLRSVAAACARRGIPFDAPENVASQTAFGAQSVVLAYLRLLAPDIDFSDEDVKRAFRVPNRYLPDALARHVTAALRSGSSFAEAVETLSLEDWRMKALQEGAKLLDRLREEKDAVAVIHQLRTVGGLDRHYSDQEQMRPHDQMEIDALDELESAAKTKSVTEFANEQHEEADLIGQFQSPTGVELRTIHGAKGLEWPTVILFGADEDQLPHARTILTSPKDDPESAVEDERRLVYVAFTRAKERLGILHREGSESRFLGEAELLTAESPG